MVNYEYNDATHTLTFFYRDRLDTLVSNEFSPAVGELIGSHQTFENKVPLKIIFDFEKVEFVTSTFIRLCVSCAKKAGKEQFSIIKTNPLIKKTFKIAGLDGELNMS